MEIIKCKDNCGVDVELPKEKFYFRPNVYGIAINNKNEVLIADSKGTGKLWLAGGDIELGEKIFDALTREFKEKTGLRIKKIEELLLMKENFYYHKPTDEAMHAFTFFYQCQVESGCISEAGMKECEAIKNARWMPLKEIGFTDMHEEIIKTIEKIIID